MGQMNIRNVPEELMKRLKVEAAEAGVTLRELVLGKLEGVKVAFINRDIEPVEARNAVARLEHHPACKCERCKG